MSQTPNSGHFSNFFDSFLVLATPQVKGLRTLLGVINLNVGSREISRQCALVVSVIFV